MTAGVDKSNWIVRRIGESVPPLGVNYPTAVRIPTDESTDCCVVIPRPEENQPTFRITLLASESEGVASPTGLAAHRSEGVVTIVGRLLAGQVAHHPRRAQAVGQ